MTFSMMIIYIGLLTKKPSHCNQMCTFCRLSVACNILWIASAFPFTHIYIHVINFKRNSLIHSAKRCVLSISFFISLVVVYQLRLTYFHNFSTNAIVQCLLFFALLLLNRTVSFFLKERDSSDVESLENFKLTEFKHLLEMKINRAAKNSKNTSAESLSFSQSLMNQI